MLILTLAGNTGKDAEYRSTQGGSEYCAFTVAAETGYGDKKQTTWVDVTKWGKGSEGLARILRKGSKVSVIGEMSLREHNSKTYVQCRADHVKVLGTPQGDTGAKQAQPDKYLSHAVDINNGGFDDDLDDDIPF